MLHYPSCNTRKKSKLLFFWLLPRLAGAGARPAPEALGAELGDSLCVAPCQPGPYLVLGAGAHPLGRMAAWSAAELGGLRHAATHTFAFIFGGLMVFDLVLLKVEPLILLHHVLCLGGLRTP